MKTKNLLDQNSRTTYKMLSEEKQLIREFQPTTLEEAIRRTTELRELTRQQIELCKLQESLTVNTVKLGKEFNQLFKNPELKNFDNDSMLPADKPVKP